MFRQKVKTNAVSCEFALEARSEAKTCLGHFKMTYFKMLLASLQVAAGQ